MAKKRKNTLSVVEKDPWLKPCEAEIEKRYERYTSRLAEIEDVAGSIVDFANGYSYYGFNYDSERQGIWFREWLPAAHDVYLFGDFNYWNKTEMPLKKESDGNWSIFLPDETFAHRLTHGSQIKMLVHSNDGWNERIPSYIRRVVQDSDTGNWNGQLWNPPEAFDWGDDAFDISTNGPLFIYECHVGMAQEKAGIGTFAEFTENILPRIKTLGYNTIQLMAVAEHPYYGSFGYHVSSFFAVSSRFGTPEDLKTLVRTAHDMGIAVIMDLVHSHYVKNIHEGLNRLDGTDYQYSPAGTAGDHPYWDSKLFDYRKDKVQHFLLSNVKYWIEEFHFDGFRFDGVTSMCYHNHGFMDFERREQFFDGNVNLDGLLYLTFANALAHSLNRSVVTIAEDVSGMPGMCFPAEGGGVGFDYRLGMAVPDFWIKILKDQSDEQWNIYDMWNIMTNRLPEVKTVAYAESHDQALVGDKTLAFRLMDSDMYTSMDHSSVSVRIDRGMALHKMIRLFTIALGGQAYLTFMGNEFGHPEWIDFPRAGNGWSYRHARRQWSLVDNGFLRYSMLGLFDVEMLDMVKKYRILEMGYAWNLQMDEEHKTIVFNHGDLVFVFNWHPTVSLPDYAIQVPLPGRYEVILTTDSARFGGAARIGEDSVSFSFPHDEEDGSRRHYMQIYNVNRCATVFNRIKDEH